jgi:hypothetical protein
MSHPTRGSRGLLSLLSLSLVCLLAASAEAETKRELPKELAPQVALSLSPDKGIVTGDVLTLKLSVQAKPGVEVAVPEQSFAPFELLDRKAHSEQAGAQQQHTFELTFLALEPGTHTFPGVKLRVVGPKGELGDVTTAPQTVQVASLLANEPNAEPKAPSKPVSVMQDDYTLAWIGGGILFAALIAAATLLISRWLKRRPKPVAPPAPPRPAWDVAIERLLQLEREKEGLLASERAEQFVDGVSAVLREYLGRRYGFDGLESTTDEVLRTLERIRPHKLSLSGVSLLLEQCDLVKFARAAPDLATCDDLWNGALGLVRATTPQETPVAAPQVASARPS